LAKTVSPRGNSMIDVVYPQSNLVIIEDVNDHGVECSKGVVIIGFDCSSNGLIGVDGDFSDVILCVSEEV
jgi:hypothetical protein